MSSSSFSPVNKAGVCGAGSILSATAAEFADGLPTLGGAAAGRRRRSSGGSAITDSTSRPGAVSRKDWGYPGFLSAEESLVFERFREEVHKGDEAFRSTVFCFAAAKEDETYALCRWLRARKFNLDAAIRMVEEATRVRREPADNDFYPDARKALGVEPSIFLAQYPQLYTGHAKEGFPLFVSKPGVVDKNVLDCITTIPDGVLRYHWHCLMHDFVDRLRAQKVARGDEFERFECICVMDLANLTASQVGSGALDIFKVNLSVDSLCFPETLHRLIIINAPSFFPMTWSVIKGLIDPRTASKVEIFSSASGGQQHQQKWVGRLLELFDPSNLPRDYGGDGESTPTTLQRMCQRGNSQQVDVDTDVEGGGVGLGTCSRQWSKLMVVRPFLGSPVATFGLVDGEVMELAAFTRSRQSATISVLPHYPPAGRRGVQSEVTVKHGGRGGKFRDDHPTRAPFSKLVRGPGKFQVSVQCGAVLSTEYFFVVGKVKHAKEEKIQICSTISNKCKQTPEARTMRRSLDRAPSPDVFLTDEGENGNSAPMSRNVSILHGIDQPIEIVLIRSDTSKSLKHINNKKETSEVIEEESMTPGTTASLDSSKADASRRRSQITF